MTSASSASNEAQLQAVIAATPDVMMVLDATGIYHKVFQTGVDKLIAPPHELEGQSIHDLLPAEAAAGVQGVIDAVLRTGTLHELSYSLSIADEVVAFHARVVPLELDGERRVLWVARDVTQMREAQIEREEFLANVAETQKLESLGLLAGGIAHDFNNILVGVMGGIELLQAELEEGSDGQAIAEDAATAARRAADLCRQMLLYAGRKAPSSVPVELAQLARDAAGLAHGALAGAARIEWDVQAPGAVRGDPTQLLQVLLNLMTNAAEAIDDPPGTVRVVVRRMALDATELGELLHGFDAAPGTFAVVEVHDDGAGMSDDVVSRVFEPFYTTKFDGRGLGLAAVIGIVRAHGGAIDVRSVVGTGTVFRVLLPHHPGAAGPTADAG